MSSTTLDTPDGVDSCSTFVQTSHPTLLLSGLRDLLLLNSLTDYNVVASGQRFAVHRVVLAAVSPYFRELFCGSGGSGGGGSGSGGSGGGGGGGGSAAKPSSYTHPATKAPSSSSSSSSSELVLDDITAEGLQRVLEFIYTGTLDVTQGTVVEVRTASPLPPLYSRLN